MCQLLGHNGFIATKVEEVIRAARMNSILSLAMFISGTLFLVLLTSLHLKNNNNKEESRILPVANTDHRHFLMERKQATESYRNSFRTTDWFPVAWVVYAGSVGPCTTVSLLPMPAPTLLLILQFWISHLAFMILYFLTNKTGVIVIVPYLDRRPEIEEELESTLQAQVLCKYLILSRWGKCQESMEPNIYLFVMTTL